jgi:prolyl-tRNA synthetase
MGAKLQDETGELKSLEMGCYGIGITRILAAAIEQGHDDYGMILPMAIAPYQVMVLPLQMKDEEVVAAAEEIYAQLKDAGVEVLLDDRDLRAGGKFKDADLIGVPLRVSIGGRGLKEGNVEFKVRGADGHELISKDLIVSHIRQAVDTALASKTEVSS